MYESDIKVSVLIPVYNTSCFVEFCIQSVQRQTLDSLEILLIDDGSTDTSREIILQCGRKDPRIRCIFNQENLGAGAARNLGLRFAKGKYIAFLDSDDLFYNENALARMVYGCETNHVPVCASYRNELKNGRIVDADMFKNWQVPENGCMVSFLKHQNDFFFQSYIYNACFLRDNDIVFPNYRRYEDPPFLLKALDITQNFWLMPTILHCYRKGHQNLEKNGIHITDSLSGLRDNLLLAENRYPILYEKLIERIDRMFRQDILNNPSDGLNRVLAEINEVYKRNHPQHLNLPLIEELVPEIIS